MKHYLWAFCLLLLGCTENPKSDIAHLSGYWEIQEVTLANGSKKTYKYNDTVDFISVNDSLTGFRKKLMPGINDTYFTSDDAEALTVKVENGALNIYYKTPYAAWKETVLEATTEHLRLVNDRKDEYLYKRYTPIKLDLDTPKAP